MLAKCFLALAVSVTLLLALPQDSNAQTPAQSPERGAAYPRVVQDIRSAQKKITADSRDIYPLIEIVQGAAYPKAIREAAQRGDDAALLELYQAKHGEQWPRTVAGTPLLSYAAMNGDVDVVRRLIERGADVKAANAEGWTALHYAAEAGNVQIVNLLLNHGADANARTTRFSETPLMLACGLFGGGKYSPVCARVLLTRRASVNAQTKDGETALMFAAFSGRLDTVRLLLSQQADTSLKDFKGNTALSRVADFLRIDPTGKISYTQDSPSVPTYTLTVFEALIHHGTVMPGRYVSDAVEKEVEQKALADFLTIARLLQPSGTAVR